MDTNEMIERMRMLSANILADDFSSGRGDELAQKFTEMDKAGLFRPVTHMWAWSLSDLIRAIGAHQKLVWYPDGAKNPEIKADYVMRGITLENGNFGSSEDDIRTKYVWLSGIGERFIPVTEVIDALSNIDGHLGLDKPIATIEER